jgi:hypothetical protein
LIIFFLESCSPQHYQSAIHSRIFYFHQRSRMNRKAGAGIAAAIAVIVAGTLGTSYYMGGKLQQSFTEGLDKWSEHGVKIQVTSYDRGAFLPLPKRYGRWTAATSPSSSPPSTRSATVRCPWAMPPRFTPASICPRMQTRR